VSSCWKMLAALAGPLACELTWRAWGYRAFFRLQYLDFYDWGWPSFRLKETQKSYHACFALSCLCMC